MVMDDANLDLAVEGCLWGGFGTSGQRCTAASRVVVHQTVYRRFLEQFVERARALRVGDGLEPSTQMGPSISQGQLETVTKYVQIGTAGGPARWGLARLAETLGQADDASALYAEALDAARAVGARPMQARIALHFGRFVAAREPRRAKLLLEEGARLASELGMAGLVRYSNESARR